MSKLEQLARIRAAERPLDHLIDGKTKYDYEASSGTLRSISLLSKLKKGSSVPGERAGKPTLAERLKANSNKKSPTNFVYNGAGNEDSNSPQTSLHSKLLALGKRTGTRKAPFLEKESLVNEDKSIEKPPQHSLASVSWDIIRSQRSKDYFCYADVPIEDSLRDVIETVVTPCQENVGCKRIQKRKYDDIFTVFYPHKQRNTNNFKEIQQAAASNFQKPSPDDIVLNAQSKVFNQVSESVSNLNISSGKPLTSGDWYEGEEEKLVKDEVSKGPYKKVTVPTKPNNPVNVKSYLENAKPHCSFVVLGHVDAGKSTLMGRLLYDIGAVDSNHIRKLKRESERIGKGSFHLAWVMDQTQEERERGVTVSICTSDFETDKTRFTIVDAPGHRDFVPNAIAGISQADVALLCVDCGVDAFESGFNLDGQTKEHTLLARSMGVSQIIVAMNKMDTVEWHSGRFDQIKNELTTFFNDVGFKEDQVSWVPCSGLSGEGVCKTPFPENASWYDGLSLIDKLEDVAVAVSSLYNDDVIGSPFLFSILEVLSTGKNEEAIISGRVESGSIQPGEIITIYPSEQSIVVTKILTGNEKKSSDIVTKGDFATLKLRHAHPEDIETGDLAASVDYNVPAMNEFSTQLLTFKMDRPLLPGTSFILFRGVCQQPARIARLISIVDKQDPSKILKKKVKHLGSNQAAIAEIELTERKRWLPILKFKQNKRLGRILLRKDGRTIAAGAVI